MMTLGERKALPGPIVSPKPRHSVESLRYFAVACEGRLHAVRKTKATRGLFAKFDPVFVEMKEATVPVFKINDPTTWRELVPYVRVR